MKGKFFYSVIRSLRMVAESNVIMLILAVILLMPLIATTGQFYSSGFYTKTSPLLLFYWPGSSFEIKLNVTVWIFMLIIFISYLAGIIYLMQNQSLGKVAIFTILIFIISNIVKSGLTTTLGWQENPVPDLTGKANYAILSLWHNPLWEELVFRGIPLLILLAVEKFITKRRTVTGTMLYILVPSVICGIYHIPGHGILRFFDTILIAAGFAWMALRYSFFAPLVMHYIADAIMVAGINKIPSVQPSEVKWIVEYGNTINSVSTILTLAVFVLLPVMTFFYYMKLNKLSHN